LDRAVRLLGMDKKPNTKNDGKKMPAAGPHSKPEQVDTRRTPGSGTLAPPGSADPNDMAPTG
jgi:hypothetical protein